MNPIIVIPSRMASTRLPGKPLADIHGRPMIVHVLDRAREADIGPVAVACADAEIADAVRAAGGIAVMTDPSLPSGSDRVHAALPQLDPTGPARRGRQPARRSADHAAGAAARRRHAAVRPRASTSRTLVAPITDPSEAALASVVKAACAFDRGRAVSPALYFSRAAIPSGEGPLWHHIGVYAYRRAALARFVALPESPLERREKPRAVARARGGNADRLRARRASPVRGRHAAPISNAPAQSWPEAPRSDDPTRDHPHDLVPGPPRRLLGPRLPHRLSRPGRTLPCDTFEEAIDAVRDGDARARNAALREQPRRPGAGHPPTAAAERALHRRRGISSASSTACSRRKARRSATIKRAHSHAVALGQVPQHHPRTRRAGGRRDRYRGRGRAGRRAGTTSRTRRSPRRSPPNCSAWRSCAPTSRTRRTTRRGST